MKNLFLGAAGLVLLVLATMCAGQAKADELNRDQIKITIWNASHKYGVDYALALAIAKNESRLNPKARGTHGEVGVFQLHPKFHRIGSETANIYTAIRYLAKLKNTCAGYGDAYFVCYNYGTTRKLKYPHRFAYYRKVKKLMRAETLFAKADK